MEYSRLVEGTDKPLDLQDDIYVSRAPGRLDVMGGIADYSGSLVLQVTSALLFSGAVLLFECENFIGLGLGVVWPWTWDPIWRVFVIITPIMLQNAPYPWAAIHVGSVPVETREDSILWVLASRDVAHYLWVPGPLECSCQSKKHAMWQCSGVLQASNDCGSIPWHGNWPQAEV